MFQKSLDFIFVEVLGISKSPSDVRLGLYDGPKNAARRQLTPCLLAGYFCLREGNFEILQAFA